MCVYMYCVCVCFVCEADRGMGWDGLTHHVPSTIDCFDLRIIHFILSIY